MTLSDNKQAVPFTKRMRQASKNIHDKSDALVNLKLGLTLSDETVWSEGILTFASIFLYLEEALTRNKDSLLGDLDVEGIRRTQAINKDLESFYGISWKEKLAQMHKTEAVKNYICHLEKIENENPYLLAAYIYHLFMGLMSGGQILDGKRKLSLRKVDENAVGEALFKFEKPHTIGSLKKQLRGAMEEMAGHLDEETQEKLLEESVKVFELNNTLIHSVKGINEAFWKLSKRLFIVALIVILISYLITKYLM